eukprot:CAMPEP_0197323906 /NCGR_PEP_ID=MMETSP0891-20130614/70799_1 /TAXON_ID=44058 ORGANISM="Aureoumbra lagunensis, Strain CCMP1510" /NCGR_SAMPLE_ID=MMETSP0891 /ASSEMBLY_ACC=CAM_ASM_000534 /LENGTH=371 /DNA_ID=CAMNT_0042816639 /DNA_START=790 /DNA_END=1905 /DNA_ORIENTATION=+
MSLSTTSVADVMVPAEKIFALHASDTLNQDTIRNIYNAGYSRIPVIQQNGFITEYILLKDLLLDLMLLAPIEEDNSGGPRKLKKICELPTRSPVWIQPDHSLFDLLNEFQTGSTHIAFVYQPPPKKSATRWSAAHNTFQQKKQVVGILTLEDIIEVILTEEIYDEADRTNAAQVLRRFFFRIVLPKLRTKNICIPNEDNFTQEFDEHGTFFPGISTDPLLRQSENTKTSSRVSIDSRISTSSNPVSRPSYKRGFSEKRIRSSLDATNTPGSPYRRRRFIRRSNTHSADRFLAQPAGRLSQNASNPTGGTYSASRLLVNRKPLVRSNSLRHHHQETEYTAQNPMQPSSSSSSIEADKNAAEILPVDTSPPTN